MSKFAQSAGSRFQGRGNFLWHSGGSVNADLACWTGGLSGYPGIEDHADIAGQFFEWDGLFFNRPYVVGDFQLWNSLIWGDLGLITGSFQPFSASYPYGIKAQYSFNHILAELAFWQADMGCGGSVSATFNQVSGASYGNVGMLLGINAWMSSVDGHLYAGAAVDAPAIGNWSAEISGHVTHVDRISANLALWECKIDGDSSRIAEIVADVRAFSATMVARQENPGEIVGRMSTFTGFIDAIPGNMAEIDGSLYLWGATDRLYGAHGFPPEIIGDLPRFDGIFGQESDKSCSTTLTHTRGEIR
jgi:hypothetical protein